MRYWILFILGAFHSFAQPLRLSTTQLTFPPCYEVNKDSQIVTFYNDNSFPVEVSHVGLYTIYDDLVFYPNIANFIVNPSDSQQVKIFFEPKQNIYYNTEILFKTYSLSDNLFYGTLRLDVRGQGKFINPYYNTTENLIEEDLKLALKNRINLGFSSQGYSQRILMFSTFDNWKVNGRGSSVDKVECVYTGRIIENYPMNTGTLVNSPWNFNTEHVFPQSFFSQNEPMRSDFFHLFPTDENINNTRGNLPFDWVSNPTGQSNGCKWNSTHFEPRDAFKGTAARALMYFYLKYQDYSGFFAPQENVLRQWHFLFPPDNIEKKRCADIYTYQQNRNPFIDYPQFLKRITKLSSFSAQPISYQWLSLDTIIDFGNRTLGSDWYYDFVIVNSGNQDFIFQNIQVTNNQVQFIQGNSDTTLAPGEALTIRLKINSLQPIQDELKIYFPQLSFEWKVPIVYHSTTQLYQLNSTKIYKIYPNPSSKTFSIEPKTQHLRCFNNWGQEMILKNYGQFWECENCSDGMYLLQIDNQFLKIIINE